MAGVLKTFPEIINNMISTAEAESDLTDFNPGSVGRTILEAAALQDADQYVQIATIQDTFSIDSASGDDLDRRSEDYAGVVLPRFEAEQSFGTLTVGDDRVTKKASGVLAVAVTPISTTALITFDPGVVFSDFPAAGVLIFERDSGPEEKVAYSSVISTGPTTATFNLVVSPVSSHAIGTSLILSQQGSNQGILDLTICLVPPTAESLKVEFETIGASVLRDGEVSVAISARSKLPGLDKNVADTRINTFQSKPFSNATVINLLPFAGGRDRETDDEFRERIRSTVASLENGTSLSVENAALKVKLLSGQRVVTAQAVQPVISGDESILYIDDGQGFSPSSVRVEIPEILIQNAEAGEKRAQTKFWPLVTDKIRICRSTIKSVQPPTTPNITTFGNTLTDTTQTFTAVSVVGKKLVDHNGQVFTILAGTIPNPLPGNTLTLSGTPQGQPIPGQNYFIYDPLVALSPIADFVCDFTTGAIELNIVLLAGEGLILERVGDAPFAAAYEYYTGLLQEVQRVVNGDPFDQVNYPGVKGLGARVRVATPQILLVSISIGISRENGTEDLLYTPIKNALLSYVNSRKIGQNVVNAEIIRIAQQQGATDTHVVIPSGNIIVLDGQLVRTTLLNISVT